MDPRVGIIGGVAGMVLVLAVGLGWLGWRARELRRLRGYVVIPPPGRHSTGGRRRGAKVPLTRAPVVSRPRPAARGAKPASALESIQELERSRRADPAAASQIPARTLVAPVELWFGSECVGVVKGSETHRRFLEYAGELLAELDDPDAPQQERPRRLRWRRATAAALVPGNGYARDA